MMTKPPQMPLGTSHAASRAVLLGCLVVLVSLPVAGQGRGKRPRVVFDEDSTPLQRALEQTIKNKRNEMRGSSPACEMALQELEELEAREAAGEEIDPKVKERAEKQAAARCKVPRAKKEKFGPDKCPDCGNKMNPAGKIIGKKIVTETTLDYETPDQRGRGQWANVSFPARLLNPLAGQGLAAGGTGVRVRSAALFTDASANDDKDCIDRVTGGRKGGLDPTTQTPVPDGDPASCFDASGELKSTLQVIPGGCQHTESGATFSGDPSDGFADDCYDENGVLQTTLEELIDEDSSEAGDEDGDGTSGEDPPGDLDGDGNPNDDDDCLADTGDIRQGPACVDPSGELLAGFLWLVDEDGDDPIDQDADGQFDEDPAVTSDAATACSALGGDLVGPEGCDLSRAVIAAVNRQAMEQHGKKVFKADENGVCDPAMSGEVECGAEARRVKLTETFVVRCEPGAEFVNGECLTPMEMAPVTPASFTFSHGLSSAARQAHGPAPASLDSATDRAMMGFTFAPPVLEWGYKIEEEACVDLGVEEICAEVFFARVGYEFDIAAGLRLPVEVTVDDIPSRDSIPSRALAEDVHTLKTSLTPLDFTAQDYKDFCQQHHLDQERFIPSCERFSFPEFFSAFLAGVLPGSVAEDGSEFVARAVIFAGLQVRVAMVPVISYGVDVDLDIPTMCTFTLLFKDNQFNISLLNFGNDAVESRNLLEALKSSGLNCASFTTPWGFAPDPITQVPRLRTFPLVGSFTIPADCAEALVKGPRINVKGQIRPICTGIIVGMHGASMGVDLGLELAFGSTLITADWDVSGDANTSVGDRTAFYEDLGPPTGPQEPELGPITFDNFSSAGDVGVVTLDDFTYLLNAFQLRLSAKLGFGGILSPIPDIADFTLLTIVFSGGQFGIPIPQHAGTEPIQVPIFVENHALSLDATPETLLIKPGEFGDFTIGVENLGSVTDNMDQFARALSNQRNQSSPFSFLINQNTDFDCVDSATGTQHFRGDPHDAIADDCFTAAGDVKAGRTETINEDDLGPAGALAAVRDEDGDGFADEDPPDVWATMPDAATFGGLAIQNVPAHSTSAQTLTLKISPFRHPLTAPGLYPVQIAADSQQARTLGLQPQDPLGQFRLDASDVVFIQVDSFFDPQVAVQPDTPAAKPGVGVNFAFEASNGGNASDTVLLSTQFIDFNQAACTLTTLGSLPGCPFRAVPTRIPPEQWTTVAGLGQQFGPLNPLGVGQGNFTVLPPSDWAGMEDTTYEFIFTGTSNNDPEAPPAKNSVAVRQTVIATKESMTRYIGLEIDELILEIQNARAQRVRTGGTLPIAQRAVKSTNDRALQNILAGNLAGASRNHAANIRIMQGFLRALDGARPPAVLADDWRARANAIISDMTTAQASSITSAASALETTTKATRKR